MADKRVLGRDALLEVRAMYEERLGNGVRRYSQAQIAKILGVSETTVFRAVRALGAYVEETDNLAAPPTEAQQAAIAAALARTLALLEAPATPPGQRPESGIDWDTLRPKGSG